MLLFIQLILFISVWQFTTAQNGTGPPFFGEMLGPAMFEGNGQPPIFDPGHNTIPLKINTNHITENRKATPDTIPNVDGATTLGFAQNSDVSPNFNSARLLGPRQPKERMPNNLPFNFGTPLGRANFNGAKLLGPRKRKERMPNNLPNTFGTPLGKANIRETVPQDSSPNFVTLLSDTSIDWSTNNCPQGTYDPTEDIVVFRMLENRCEITVDISQWHKKKRRPKNKRPRKRKAKWAKRRRQNRRWKRSLIRNKRAVVRQISLGPIGGFGVDNCPLMEMKRLGRQDVFIIRTEQCVLMVIKDIQPRRLLTNKSPYPYPIIVSQSVRR